MVYYGFTQLDQMLSMWQSFGVFKVFLPFILIFAVVFAILNKSKVLGGRGGIDTIVAISIAMLAIQQEYATRFMATLFPNLSMGISVLLALLILVGLFMVETSNAWRIIMAVVGFIIFIVVVTQTQTSFSWRGSIWWQQWGGLIIMGLILAAIIVVTAMTSTWEERKKRQGIA